MPTKVPNPSPRHPPQFLVSKSPKKAKEKYIPKTSINQIQTPKSQNNQKTQFSMFMRNSEIKKQRSTHSKSNSRMASPTSKKYYQIKSAQKTNGSNYIRSRSSTHYELNQIRRSTDQLYGHHMGKAIWGNEKGKRGMSVNCSPIGAKGEVKAMMVEPNVFETSMNGLTNSQNQNISGRLDEDKIFVHYVRTNSNNITLNGSLNGLIQSKSQASKNKVREAKIIPEPLKIVDSTQSIFRFFYIIKPSFCSDFISLT